MGTSPEHGPPPAADPARIHTRVALAILGVAGGLCLVLLVLAHDPGFEAGMRRIRWEEAERSRNIFMPIGHLHEDGDRVLNEELPAVDHSKGGVYFVGTSNLMWALKLWALPEAERRLIHDYAVQGTGHRGQSLLVRYLVEREGLLEAGADKTLIVFGTGYQNIGFIENQYSDLSTTLGRRGFYDRGPDGSIERSRVGPLMRALTLERARLYGITSGLAQIAKNAIREGLGKPRSRVINPAEFNRARSRHMGPDWRRKTHEEIVELVRVVDYLVARGVPVVIALMPQGSWEDNTPFQGAYNDELLAACRTRKVKVLDFRKLFDDEDFADSNHPAPTGVEKFQQAVLPLCLDHLRSAGLLPASAR